MYSKTKVAIAENHRLTRKGYISLLKEFPDLEVVAEADNGSDLIKLLPKTSPHLIFLDIEMPVLNGKETLRQIRLSYPEIKVIMISYHKDEATMIEFFKLGANAFVSKDSSFEHFADVIKEVIEEGYYHNKSISKVLMQELSKPDTFEIKLTEREKQIIALTCQGKTNKQIADHLNIVVKTVDYHKTNIYKKTKTSSPSGLYNFALRSNLISSLQE